MVKSPLFLFQFCCLSIFSHSKLEPEKWTSFNNLQFENENSSKVLRLFGKYITCKFSQQSKAQEQIFFTPSFMVTFCKQSNIANTNGGTSFTLPGIDTLSIFLDSPLSRIQLYNFDNANTVFSYCRKKEIIAILRLFLTLFIKCTKGTLSFLY